MQTITRHELQAAIDGAKPPVLIEALGAISYGQGHLPGALRLQLPEMSGEYVAELLPDRAAPIVTYCSGPTCRASHGVAAKLTALDYADVRVYVGGKLDWIDAGLPLDPAPSLT